MFWLDRISDGRRINYSVAFTFATPTRMGFKMVLVVVADL